MAPPVRCEQIRLNDTIFALSSGRPPAAIGVIRISGPAAFACVEALAGEVPPPRRASLRTLCRDGVLDSALVIVFPGPHTATGEDLAELHCHGGRAVIAAVETALATMTGVRHAEPGEFTRRALSNGRIDLMEAEGLADLLEADTEGQRVAALAATEGRLSARTRDWLDRIAILSAQAEAVLDHSDEDDVADDDAAIGGVRAGMAALASDIGAALAAPSVERLHDGVRVVIAGPPNAGKSTLLNLLAERDAAIVSPIAGTTRDRVEAPVVRSGLPFLLIDTAGLTETDDRVEAMGVARARDAMEQADILLWLGDDPPPRDDALWVHARADLPGRQVTPTGRCASVSATDPGSVARCWALLAGESDRLLASSGDMPSMRDHQRRSCREAVEALADSGDPLLLAEGLATARRVLARLLGVDATEIMLDTLFARFCIGK